MRGRMALGCGAEALWAAEAGGGEAGPVCTGDGAGSVGVEVGGGGDAAAEGGAESGRIEGWGSATWPRGGGAAGICSSWAAGASCCCECGDDGAGCETTSDDRRLGWLGQTEPIGTGDEGQMGGGTAADDSESGAVSMAVVCAEMSKAAVGDGAGSDAATAAAACGVVVGSVSVR